MTDLIFLGATGHLQSVLDAALATGLYRVAAILDDRTPVGKEFIGHRVMGTTALLPELYEKGMRHVFVSAGSIGGYGNRKKWYELAKSLGFSVVNIIDPTAAVASNARLGEGVFVGKNAVVNSYAQVGNMAIVNTGSIVEHADILENYASIAPGCTLCGGVKVEQGAHLGAGSTVLQEVTIGREALVGIGSVVTRDVPPRVVAFGNPCRVIRSIEG